jgi:NADPH:quinone reductase-like Zn-dependent oxidoreductase
MASKMKAMIFNEFGGPEVLLLAEVDKPIPVSGEVLIKIRATSVTRYDTWVRSSTAPPGFALLMRIASGKTPKQSILGTELAGIIEAVSDEVTRLAVGDAVFGYTGMNLGAYATYICLPEAAVTKKPTNLSDEEAASVLQGALTALFFLQKAEIKPGQKILIFGASGGVGSYAVQLAKYYFKARVIGVCSAAKMDYVRSLGADEVIDYRKQDFTGTGEIYDVVFDTVGKTHIPRTLKSIKEGGYYLLATFGLPMLFQLLWYAKFSKIRFEYGTLAERTEDLLFLKDQLEKGVIKPLIDQVFPLEKAAEAHRYVESGEKIGSVILSV